MFNKQFYFVLPHLSHAVSEPETQPFEGYTALLQRSITLYLTYSYVSLQASAPHGRMASTKTSETTPALH